MMWAACCTAFFGLLCSSEFTVLSVIEYDPAVHLSLGDISIDRHTSPTEVRIHIKQSKIDTFRKGIQLFLGKTDHNICLVKSILPYLALRGGKFGPLFITDNNIPQSFSTSLSEILVVAQLDHHKYTYTVLG